MLWIVLGVVVVLALVALGAVAFGVFGALTRLGREATALEREARPVLGQVQATAARRSDDEPR